jgi:hypothetical protein
MLVINAFISNGFICRGGIAYGDVHYEEERSLFFEPAVNRAYQIENEEVIYHQKNLKRKKVSNMKK